MGIKLGWVVERLGTCYYFEKGVGVEKWGLLREVGGGGVALTLGREVGKGSLSFLWKMVLLL